MIQYAWEREKPCTQISASDFNVTNCTIGWKILNFSISGALHLQWSASSTSSLCCAMALWSHLRSIIVVLLMKVHSRQFAFLARWGKIHVRSLLGPLVDRELTLTPREILTEIVHVTRLNGQGKITDESEASTAIHNDGTKIKIEVPSHDMVDHCRILQISTGPRILYPALRVLASTYCRTTQANTFEIYHIKMKKNWWNTFVTLAY